MKANRSRDTGPEVALRRALHALGLRYRKHLPIVTDKGTVTPDLVFTRRRVVVFVDGCFWHQCPAHATQPKAHGAYWSEKLRRNSARDAGQSAALVAAGWRVVRVWEHDGATEAAQRVRNEVQGG